MCSPEAGPVGEVLAIIGCILWGAARVLSACAILDQCRVNMCLRSCVRVHCSVQRSPLSCNGNLSARTRLGAIFPCNGHGTVATVTARLQRLRLGCNGRSRLGCNGHSSVGTVTARLQQSRLWCGHGSVRSRQPECRVARLPSGQLAE